MATKKQAYRQPALEPYDFDAVMAELERQKPEQEPEQSGVLRRYVGDTTASVAKGAVQGVRMLTDIAGADNAASTGLRSVEDFIGGLQSAEAKKDQQEIARILKEAEGKGVLDQVVAGVRAFGVAPLQTMAQAAGTSLPTIAAALIPGAGPAAVAARVAAPLAVGAVQGAGSVKASIYDDVKQRALQEGRTHEEAEQLAVQAQSYAGENGGQIALGAGLGAWAGKSGLEGAAHRLAHGSSKAVPGMAARVATGAVAEGIPEAVQGGQEQFASNVAQDRAGFQTDAWRGVAANAAMEGLAGSAMGGAMGVPRPAGPALLPESGPMSRAANAGAIAAAGQPLEAAPSGAAPSGGSTPREGAPGNGDAPSDAVPVFNTLVLDAKATLAQPGVMDAVRARFGDDGASQLLNSLNQAQNPNAKEAVRKKHLQAVEEAMFWLNAQRVPGEVTQAAIGADAREALPAPAAQTQVIGMDDRPTGTMRVGPDGVAVPETRVDAINTAQAQQEVADTATAEQEAADSIEPQARRASAVYGEGLPKRPAPPLKMPERTPRADAVEIDPTGPNAVARYIAEQAATNTPAARAFVQDYRAGRITDADVLALITPKPAAEPTPDERLAAAAKAGQVESDSTAGLILNREGKPFKTEMAAAREQKKHPGSQVVAVEGGHAVQPAPVEEANAKVPAATEAAAPQATESAVEEGTDSSGAGTPAAGDAGSAGVKAGTAGAVEAAGLSPKETAIQRRNRLKADKAGASVADGGALGRAFAVVTALNVERAQRKAIQQEVASQLAEVEKMRAQGRLSASDEQKLLDVARTAESAWEASRGLHQFIKSKRMQAEAVTLSQAGKEGGERFVHPPVAASEVPTVADHTAKREPAIERRTRKKAERAGAAPSGDAGSKASTAQGAPETVIERRTRLKAERAARADGEAAGAGPAVGSTNEQEAATASKQSEPAPAARVIARVGRTPTAATSLELRTNADGTLTPHMEGNALLDFDSGEPIKLPANVTDAEAKQAIRDAGALSSKQHFYAPSDESPTAFSRSAEPLRKLADLAKTATNANETVAVGPVSAEQAALLAAEGVAVSETTKHTADLYAVRHALNRHGDEATEKARGQLPISADDIARVPEVVGEPDAYAVGPKTKRGDDLVGYIKRMPDGAILYIEELRTGKNRLAMLSMRKYPGAKDFASIAQSLLSNARSDTGDVRIVYPQQGDAQAFSRGKPMQVPKVTVEQDNGFPIYFTDKVRLEFPQVTARLDVIEAPGEKVVNYPIMSATGFDVLGHVELLVKDGKAKALLDIEVYPGAGGGRRAGVGREAVEAIVLGTPGDVNISNIVTEARGFWHKLGVPEQNLPDGHAYEGTLNAETLSRRPGDDTGGIRAGSSRAEGQGRGADAGAGSGADSGAEGGIDRAPGSARGEREASAERRKAVEALVARVTARWKNAPQVVVVASMADPLVPRAVRQVNAAQLSQGAEGSPEGFFHDGKVYLVAPQLRGDADVVRVLFHEALGHYGLRGTFGPELGTILDRLAVLNAGKVRAKAKQYGLDYDKPSDRRMAAEEVLAEMAQKAPDIGWAKKAVAAIRTWLREHVPGFRKMAMSDDEIVRSFILPARAFVQRGNAAPADGAGQPAFSRSSLADAVANFNQEGVRNAFLDAVTTHGKTNLWSRTVGTQYHKAQTHPTTFGRVFNSVQDYIKDTSVFANQAADLAPSLLPKLDTLADLTKDGLWRHGADPKDTAKAGEAIFQGTLNKELYDDATLRSRFGLTPKQVELYREFRAAVDQSLEGLGKTEILRIAGEAGRSVRAEVLAAPSLDDAAQILTAAVAGDQDAVQQIQEKVARVTQLQDEGYAPLMRFGKHTLHVTGPGGSTEFFGMYETVRDANRAARQLRADPEMAKFTFTQGVMSEEGHKLFNGLSMDSLELFADTTGRSDDPVFQAYLKLAIANRSALKRMIERQGIKGYSDDVARVLASFVTSNARMSAGHLHLADAKKAAEAIPKEQGDLRDDAIKLVEYVTTPTEEAAAVRGLLFTSFIGGSVASALVNMTQPITMTLPYLTQYGGAAKAGKRLTAAMAMVASGKGMDPELAAALKRAEDDGIVSPQEIHHLQAQAMNTLGKNPLLKKAAFVWGALFSLAEQFNRRVSFVAAYETAQQQGIADPFGFAEKAVIETQGLYNKGNKANVARGAVGATVMTFKQFSTHYLEFLVRMWKSGPEGKKAVAVALALLILMGGAGGLPFADDLDDLIDTLGQAMGYDTNSKRWKRQFVAQTLGLGDAVADVATRGLTAAPGFPLDLSLRMGMGNLLPATGLFLRSNTDTARQLLEVAGAAGGLAANVKDGVTKAMGGDLAAGAMSAMPVAVQNIAKAIQMAQTGEYRNAKGAKVMDVDVTDAVMKGIGFQPAQVARESGRVGEAMRSIQLAKNVEGEIAGRWAQAMVDQDAEGVAAARKQLADWNAANPTAPIKITIPQVLARVKALRQSRADRTVKAAPKEMRSTVKEALS